VKLLLLADTFYPDINSASIQLQFFAREASNQGVDISILVPTPGLDASYTISAWNEINVIRVKVYSFKVENKIARFFSEAFFPIFLLINFSLRYKTTEKWNGIIWYSPSIFFGLFIWFFKKTNLCESYLILRDIFPQWAYDIGLIKSKAILYALKLFEIFQYKNADYIGAQSLSGVAYLNKMELHGIKIELLNNWTTRIHKRPNTLGLRASKKIFVYAGNMGLAQDIKVFLNLAQSLRGNEDLEFLFIGGGECFLNLQKSASRMCLNNVRFQSRVNHDEMLSIFEQCYVGLISLDIRHTTDNIPGKFVSYISSGLPVLASINPGNELTALIDENRLGFVTEKNSINELVRFSKILLYESQIDRQERVMRCKNIVEEKFSTKSIVEQVLSKFHPRNI